MQIVTGDRICPNLSFSWRSYCFCTPQGFVTKQLLDLHRVDELKNFAANIFLKLVSKPHIGIRTSNQLVTYWELCITRRDCHYRTSLIRYWGKGSTVCWYKVLGFLYFIIACFDNSGFLGVVTLKSPSGVFAVQVFPIRKQITVSI